MNQFNMPPEVPPPLGEKVAKPVEPKPLPKDTWKKHAPGMEINGLGQLRTVFALPPHREETESDDEMINRDARLSVGVDYGSGDATFAAVRKGGTIVVPRTIIGGHEYVDILAAVDAAQARKQAATQADAATRPSPAHRQAQFAFDNAGHVVPMFAVTRLEEETRRVPASALTDEEVRELIGAQPETSNHSRAALAERERLETRFTVSMSLGCTCTYNLRNAPDDCLPRAYLEAYEGTDLEYKILQEIHRRGLDKRV